MFCPNCASKVQLKQSFCRSCGLKLDDIFQVVGRQLPTKENAKLQKRQDLFEKLGFISLSGFGIVGLALLFSEIIYYKMILFGANVLFFSGLTAFVVFGLLALFFFGYPRFFGDSKSVNFRSSESTGENPKVTAKLLEEKTFEPVPSVTEQTTNLLFVESKRKTSGKLK